MYVVRCLLSYITFYYTLASLNPLFKRTHHLICLVLTFPEADLSAFHRSLLLFPSQRMVRLEQEQE